MPAAGVLADGDLGRNFVAALKRPRRIGVVGKMGRIGLERVQAGFGCVQLGGLIQRRGAVV
eukprot:1890644-Pleurochrysis_carterae.AAC.1